MNHFLFVMDCLTANMFKFLEDHMESCPTRKKMVDNPSPGMVKNPQIFEPTNLKCSFGSLLAFWNFACKGYSATVNQAAKVGCPARVKPLYAVVQQRDRWFVLWLNI